MKVTKKQLFLRFGLGTTVILCPTIFYSVAKAQEQSDCLTVEPSGQVTIINGLCSQSSQEQELESMAEAEEFFQRGRELDRKGQSQEAIAEYTMAIQTDPNYAQAYFYRSNLLALEGQPQKGIEDAQKAAAILEARGQLEGAAAMQQHEEMIREGIEEGEW